MPIRVIPILLIQNGKLVKTCQFKNPVYVGDPINACKVFNEKEVDELIVLDISATKSGIINYELLEEIASECFMPVTYGGGISNLQQIEKIISLGIERVSINSFGIENMQFFADAVEKFGSSTIVASIDVNKRKNSYEVYTENSRKKNSKTLHDIITKLEEIEVGEILVNAIYKDGTFSGYDFDLLQTVLKTTQLPITFCGGAATLQDFKKAASHGVSGVSAGSMFVFYGPLRAVLINYVSKEELKQLENIEIHG
jgi:imidazole glycerol-phosphate synthase subunit HisF